MLAGQVLFYVFTLCLAVFIFRRHALAKSLPEAGGVYTKNYMLEFRNSPFKVTRPIIVKPDVNLTIQAGVRLLFKPGIGITVQGGILHAVVNY